MEHSSIEEKEKIIPVEGHKNLFRDEKTGAILNNDSLGYARHMSMKNKMMKERQELDDMKRDIDEIKSLLKELVKNPS